jgi:hypothetical protein
MAYYIKESTDSLQSLQKFLCPFSQKVKSILKFIRKNRKCWTVKIFLSKMNNTDSKLYNKAIETKPSWCWKTNRYVDQWNRIEEPETSPHSLSHLSFNKGIKNLHWRKDSLFNKWCWKPTGYTHEEAWS